MAVHRNRVIYQSEALFVSPDSTGYHFTGSAISRDLKTGYFSYTETVKNCKNNGLMMFIDDAKASKISDRLSKTTNPDLYLGFVDFEVNQARFPRAC